MGREKKVRKVPQTHPKKGNGSPLVAFLAVCVMCLSVLFALSLTVFFKTKSITVQGLSPYSREQIIAASGMSVGKNMFISVFGGASKNIETLLPYVGEAKITRNLDGNVVITVEATGAETSYEAGGEYLLVNEWGKVLEKVGEPSADKPVIYGVELKKCLPGYALEYKDENARGLVEDIFAAAEDNGFSVTSVKTDASFSFVDVVIGDKYLVHMLNGSDIDYKMLLLRKSLEAQPDTEEGSFSFTTADEGKLIFSPGDIHETGSEDAPAEDDGAQNEGENSSNPDENVAE